ncbi:cytochrome P450 [Heliocybe sulcata]|uniref:Cytochrome P450 n=1 Tax=Heliocybe sulcata TaxID=5364 RepID=A0A5C3MU52_9AGAM|nr:cytochrome P450 [Heliocybe sulcata]
MATLPPGPRGLPLIGNMLALPNEFQWLRMEEWHKQYGDIVHVSVFGQPMIVLNSLEAIKAAFDKKPGIYSDRPRMVMMNELLGWDHNVVTMRYGPAWRDIRRDFNQHFRQGAVYRYHPIFLRQLRKLLADILAQPEEILEHLSLAVAVPGAFLVEAIPLRMSNIMPCDSLAINVHPVKYIPSWFPGASFQRKAHVWKGYTQALANKPFEAFKANARSDGTVRSSVAETMLQAAFEDQDHDHREHLIKAICRTAYGAGSDTTAATAHNFVLAMAMYPEVQRKAQQELDAVVGSQRLPDFSDRENLPYINAIVKEVTRWQPILPLSIAHASSGDDYLLGYFIPKGSLVVGNTWSLTHSPAYYPDPEEFKPERFLTADGKLNNNVLDPYMLIFGYGRRICPGRYFADASLFSIFSGILATFDIAPHVGKDGSFVKLKPVMLPGAIVHPAPFQCVVKPRSSNTVELVRRAHEIQMNPENVDHSA